MNNLPKTIDTARNEFYKLFYQGGLQKHIPKDETQVYLNSLMLDSVKFCVKDAKSNEPSNQEKICIKSFLTKSFQLLN